MRVWRFRLDDSDLILVPTPYAKYAKKIIWWDGGQSYSIDRPKVQKHVSELEHYFLQAFLQEGDRALGTDRLEYLISLRNVGHVPNVSRTMQNLANKFPGYVRMPGDNYGTGYAVSVRKRDT
jgi:hypothetical protein